MDKTIVLTVVASENRFSGYSIHVDIWNFGKVRGASFGSWENVCRWLVGNEPNGFTIIVRTK